MYYVLTLVYKKELYLFDFFLIHMLRTSIRERNLASPSVLVCGSLAPLSGGDLNFYQEM